MFASLAALALAQPISIPLDKPKNVERPVAPIERAGPLWAYRCGGSDDWEKPAPPVRLFANTYMVGTCGITSLLIKGSDGDILIDGGTDGGAPMIAENIRKLGFRLSDVKYILHSHEHYDHVGGISKLQQLTGATVVASREAAKVLATGVADSADPQAGMHAPFPTVQVGRVIADGGTVRLGNLLLTAVATPGHTAGALSWHWGSCDGGICRRTVYADSLSPVSSDAYRFSDHPPLVAAFRSSIAKIAALDCDIVLTPHPSASNMPDRMSGKAPLVNADGCKDYAATKTKALDARLAKEAAAK
ncbi:subclass B3 metallo-beta-lactamase [Sphingomonas piscis]|uniref:Subclass B3 metallo-beta-lactamase n=1 Tax=Sphingomonas piscis TaxID=2714943 RepID=A0A6G7YNU8_9SPHN|nr:subclass B3 metallo-beta-lactamase [Sphingomonas piscis]QIK78418.1 subclass B3 metallo-beta-lactamase [Sphingomonas piscis]